MAADRQVDIVSVGISSDTQAKGTWPKELQAFHQYRADLTTSECMVLYKGRALIPTTMQAETLDILHSGHQGVTAMNVIAGESVFWSGMSEAIARRRLSCRSCLPTVSTTTACIPV